MSQSQSSEGAKYSNRVIENIIDQNDRDYLVKQVEEESDSDDERTD